MKRRKIQILAPWMRSLLRSLEYEEEEAGKVATGIPDERRQGGHHVAGRGGGKQALPDLLRRHEEPLENGQGIRMAALM